jgi:hypothetical protein
VFPVGLLHAKAEERGLRYLVIGGHAINTYGEPRATLDVDFLVCKADLDGWRRLLEEEGFKSFSVSESFLQFNPPYGTNWRLDLMLVQPGTFDSIYEASRAVSCLGIQARVPSPQHLIALKLHALRHGPEHRYEKDFGDIITLGRNAKLDPASEELRQIFDRFGSPELYEQFKRRLQS